MPANDHLIWHEIKEFGGLWTAGNKFLMPSNHAQVMVGCHPQVGGGLRAFWRVNETVGGENLVNGGSPEVAAGFHVRNRGPNSLSGYGDGIEFLVATYDNASSPPSDWNLWRRRLGPGATDATWTRITTGFGAAGETSLAAPASPGPRQVSFARHGVGTVSLSSGAGPSDTIYVNFNSFSTDAGLYTVNPDAPSATAKSVPNLQLGALTQHQARLVTSFKDLLIFSDPGADLTSTNFTSGSNFILISETGFAASPSGSVTSAIPVWMVPFPPSDLLVGTADGRIVNIQGDLSDPVVREVARWGATYWHEPVHTPFGVAVIFPNDGIYLVGPSGSIEPLSESMSSGLWGTNFYQDGMGQLAYSKQFLFCPNQFASDGGLHNNGAIVYDFRTKAWFTSTHQDDELMPSPRFMMADRNLNDSGVWIVAGGSPPDPGDYLFQIQTGHIVGFVTDTERVLRNPTWEWRSAPLREPTGRQVEVREVILHVYQHSNVGTSTIEVTVGGTTVTQQLPAQAAEFKGILTFQFQERGEYLDVNVKAQHDALTSEAPMLESARIGWTAGHRVY